MSGIYDTSDSSTYDVTRIIPGAVENVRLGLGEALAQLGYRVLEENPLRARRNAQGLGRSGCSNDILESQISLNVGLKAAGPQATRATFDYGVKYPHLFDADRAVLEREVEALMALATMRVMGSVCPACDAETSGTRFCRQCGAPATTAAPAELEVLRFARQTHVSYKWLWLGTLTLVFAVLLLLPIFKGLPADKVYKIITLVSCLGMSGLMMLGVGLRRLSSLMKPVEQEVLPLVAPRRPLATPNTNALPPHATPVNVINSVTDATTDLLPEERRAATNQS